MAKRDLGLAGAVEKLVEEKVSKMQAVGQIPPPESEDSDFVDQVNSSSSPEVKKMVSSFPSSEGFFGKIYKTKPNGKWAIMDYEITAPETVNDLELEVQRIVKEKKWGNGEYRVQIRSNRKKGIFLNESVTIGDVTFVERDGSGTLTDPIENIRRTMEVVDGIRGPSNAEALSATILKAVETGRSMAPPPGDGKDNTMSLLLQIIPMVKDLFPRAPQSDVDTIVEKVVTRLQSLQPKEDFFQSLIKYQEAMNKLNPPEKKEREIDSIKKVTDIVSAIQPLTRGSAAEPPSVTQLIFEHGAKLLEPIISTLKEFAEAKKMEMQIRIDQAYGGVNPAQIEKRPVNSNLPATRIHPFVARIIKAINEGDESYFDMMRQQIVRFYGPHIIDGLISGDLTSDLVIDTIHTELGLPLNIPNLKLYFDKFVAYLKGMDREPSVKGEVLAECKLCHEQYDFNTMEDWRKDSKKCDACQGDLELVKGESEA
jgi:hypothetical protein